MKWEPRGPSEDLEDRRGEDEASAGGGGRGGIRIGLGGLALLAVLSLATGRNFFSLLDTGVVSVDTGDGPAREHAAPAPGEDQLVQFVSFVIDDVQATWEKTLGDRYEHTRLVLFRDATRSGCGEAETGMGPFYCPVDRKVYIDLGFYDELKRRFGAPGDFAQAYVLAHEIGHHVQNLLGVLPKVHAAEERDPDQANALSVRLELQADCLAGVWGHSTEQRQILEAGDVEEALGAAAAVGDDRIQKQATGSVHRETWTHGSARQRVAWFRRGLDAGDVASCDTFGTQLPEDR